MLVGTPDVEFATIAWYLLDMTLTQVTGVISLPEFRITMITGDLGHK